MHQSQEGTGAPDAYNVASKLYSFFVVGLALAAAPAAAQDWVGIVKRASGEVVIERDGMNLTPTPGTEVMRGDRVITGANGYAQIRLRGAPPVSVSPGADVALDRFIPGTVIAERHEPGLFERLASFFAVNRNRQ
jgi:hypothetical protein